MVDDVVFSQMVFLYAFRGIYKNITFANNGKEAIDALKNDAFDIVFMDIEMPVLSGIDAIKIIRKELPEPQCNMPIIAVTGHDDPAYLQELLSIGFTDYSPKLLSTEAVKLIVDKYIISKKRDDDATSGQRQRSYNLRFLEDIGSNNKELEKELVSYFVAQAPETIKKMYVYVERQNWTELKQTAHKFTSQLNYFGLDAASAISHEIENSPIENIQDTDLIKMISSIEQDCEEIIYEIKQDYELT